MTSICDNIKAMNYTRYSVRIITDVVMNESGYWIENDGYTIEDDVYLHDDCRESDFIEIFGRILGISTDTLIIGGYDDLIEIYDGNIPIGYFLAEY